ncbi:hypothetical protein KHA93_17145 [Bacillus sp. FJAT-49732]|uniref:Uncharacterized protein n=1 Tax=Lederbergia citrisecunda TaxID=2833583 RepID=A0A942YLD5_9BACI|nr:hypothetical protein [Lederbergia citrisecunda]MBS4201363.1 hypothetical protein [Lederbergia citrisecunda]
MSAVIESTSTRKHFGWSYLKHVACGIVCAGLFSLMSFTASIIAFIYVTVFFIIDNVLKHLDDKKQ